MAWADFPRLSAGRVLDLFFLFGPGGDLASLALSIQNTEGPQTSPGQLLQPFPFNPGSQDPWTAFAVPPSRAKILSPPHQEEGARKQFTL